MTGSLTLGFDPGSFVESNSVDNESLAFPVPDRMSCVCRLEILRMLCIHINDAKTVWPADIEDEDPLRVLHFDDLETIGCSHLTRAGRRWTGRLRSRARMLRVYLRAFWSGSTRRR